MSGRIAIVGMEAVFGVDEVVISDHGFSPLKRYWMDLIGLE